MHDAPLKVGDFVTCDDAPANKPFMVITVNEHTVRIKEWPILDAPPAREVLRSQVQIHRAANHGGQA
jgi:hypothetical protein